MLVLLCWRRNYYFFVTLHKSDRHNRVVVAEIHHSDALRRTSNRADIGGWRAQNLALLGDDEQLFVLVHLPNADDLAVLIGHLDVLDADAASAGDAILVERRSLGVALLCDREQRTAGLDDLHCHHLIAIAERDA